jgi:hypothetical protein
MQTSWGRVWSEAAQVQRKRSRFGVQMQHRRRSGDAVPADLMLGFEPITKGIAFASGLHTLLENVLRPLADLRVRTAAYHGFLLPLWLSGGTPAAITALQGPFLMDQAS